MDANGTHFQIFLTADDWGRWRVDQQTLRGLWAASAGRDVPVAWTAGELTLQPRLFRYMAAPADVQPDPDQRRGAAADRFGNLYWIDEDRQRIRVQSVGSGEPSTFWPPATPPQPMRRGDFGRRQAEVAAQPPRLGAMAVTADHRLVVGTSAPAGLMIFDLFAGGEPTTLRWPPAVAFDPFDMTARPDGGVYILDRTNRRYWALDRGLDVFRDQQAETTLRAASSDAFQPVDPRAPRRGRSTRVFPEGITVDAASPIDVADPFGIEALPDGTVLVLDRAPADPFSRVVRYCLSRRVGSPVGLDGVARLIEEGENVGFGLTAHDLAFVPAAGSEPAQLLVMSSEGNQVFALQLKTTDTAMTLTPLPRYFPVRRFGGKGLLVSPVGAFYDFADRWVPLTCQARPRYPSRAVIDLGDAPTIDDVPGDLDSGEPDCVWHRLLIDGSIPVDTRVAVWSRAADDRGALAGTPWLPEPDLYLRRDGAEIPWLPPRSSDPPGPRDGTWELLFQQARGRYLQLRLVITGNERATPRLRALRVWHPRFSYVRKYLPAVYREDAASGDFLERFLANTEGFFTAIEDRIANVQMLFDWRSAPREALDWLAGWFDAALDPAWDERRRRMFVRHAVHFFQFRGTIHGLRMALALALDPRIGDCELEGPGCIPETRQRVRVVERYLTRRTPAAVLGQPLPVTGLREVSVQAAWKTDEGGARLGRRYADDVVAATGTTTRPPEVFALVPPTGAAAVTPWQATVASDLTGDARDQALADAAQAHWTAFATQVLGFVPSAADERAGWQAFLAQKYRGVVGDLNAAHGTTVAAFDVVTLPRDLPTTAAARDDWRAFLDLPAPARTVRDRHLWQDFLARRYRQIATLNAAYGTGWTGFAEVATPDVLPSDGAPLADWYQFEAVVKSMQRQAHRFSVFLPTTGEIADRDALAARLELARRVIELSKPAHTVFDVSFYWALCRVGEARLGFDTVVDLGSRAPQLAPPFVLDGAALGSGRLPLPPGHPAGERLTLECSRTN
jgi:phage tail-like protein